MDLRGLVAVVTGANSGMGKETARELARLGADAVLACRSRDRGEAARADIAETARASAVTVMELDLASPASVRAFAGAFHRRFASLDVLVNNAAASLSTRQLPPRASSVIGRPTCSVRTCSPRCSSRRCRRPAAAASSNVSTRAAGGLDLSDTQFERRRYSGSRAYRVSKQASRMLTWALADRLRDEPVTVNALNPGYVLTPLTANATGPLRLLVALTGFAAQTPLDGAGTAIWLATSPDVDGVTGRFWHRRHEIPCRFRDPGPIGELWRLVDQQLSAACPDVVAGG